MYNGVRDMSSVCDHESRMLEARGRRYRLVVATSRSVGV